jgi:hypothetical protein
MPELLMRYFKKKMRYFAERRHRTLVESSTRVDDAPSIRHPGASIEILA